MSNEKLVMNGTSVNQSQEEAEEALAQLPDLPLSPHPNYVTHSGLAQLHERLAAAEARRPELDSAGPAKAAEAAEFARDMRWLQARLSSAIVVESDRQSADRVAFGASVEAVDQHEHRHRYRIVGEDQADPEHGLVSWVSPLARALEGARVGDNVAWKRPAGDLEIEVLSIDYAAS